jgi:N-acetyl-gamma-glutamylphosphate reductase
MINIGIIGGSGYTAELIRMLMFHPLKSLICLQHHKCWKTIISGAPWLLGDIEMGRHCKPNVNVVFSLFGTR